MAMAMTWRKSPEQLVEAFSAALPDDPRVERRKMFGYQCAFVNGNMFCGLHQENLVVRLPEEERNTLVEKDGAHIFAPFPGRIMKEYVSMPDALIADTGRLRSWLMRSLEYTAALPAKGARKGTAAKKAAAPKKAAAKKTAAKTVAGPRRGASR
jgi:TfoX/Sxy family transcriptional regulator of competence genes